jgi:hypothetical protein
MAIRTIIFFLLTTLLLSCNTTNDNKHQLGLKENWKQFIFSSNREDDIIFSVSCLKDIIDFIENEIEK